MARSDQGYTQARKSTGGGGGRGRSFSTYAKEAKKDELVSFYLRHQLNGILDILGEGPRSETAMAIKQGLAEQYDESKMTKAELEEAVYTDASWDGVQALRATANEARMAQEAALLIDALQSATRDREMENLDEGDWLDDPVSLIADGSGWGEERLGAREFRKHVSIAMDNSGSTHMASTGYCARAMETVANNLLAVLHAASSQWPGVTWDAYSFNRITRSHTGRFGRDERYELVRQSLAQVTISDPLRTDAIETNLAPLIQRMYETEDEHGLLGSPRLDIILTDGEFESQADADAAAEWQRRRGPGVTTYVLNLCPETPSEVALPYQFRVIPLTCVTGDEHRKTVDGEGLRQALMQIVLSEIGK
jgi:hypothetical protein